MAEALDIILSIISGFFLAIYSALGAVRFIFGVALIATGLGLVVWILFRPSKLFSHGSLGKIIVGLWITLGASIKITGRERIDEILSPYNLDAIDLSVALCIATVIAISWFLHSKGNL